MKKVIEVMKWEFVEKVKTKAFLISMILTPVFIVAMGILPSLLATKSDTKVKKIAIIDLSNSIADKLAATIQSQYKLEDGRSNYDVQVLFRNSDLSAEKMIAEADKLVLDEKIENYIILDKDILTNGKGVYRGTNVSNIREVERFQRSIRSVLSEITLVEKGIDASILKELNKPVDLKSIKISKEGIAKESGFLQTFITSYIFIILLMFLILMTGQFLVRSLVEEKSNRIIEILISSCSPMELMAGKILGLSALGLVQIIMWIIIGIGTSIALNFSGFSLDNLILILIYFLLGYIFYASIFVAIGSLANTEQEAQQFTSYVSMFLVLPIVLAFTAMQDPNTPFVKILSYIPFLTPTFMVLRIPITMPPLWEILATIALLLASTIGMIWVASKIFRIGILMYGKAPSLNEVFKLLKTK